MKIAMLGDIALIGKYSLSCGEKARERVELVREITAECDFVIGNLESPLTQKKTTLQCKGAYVRSDEENVKLLKYMNVTHVNLANNHIYDYGAKGQSDTLKTLESAGIEYVGLCGGAKVLSSGDDRAMLDGFCCLSANPIHYGNGEGETRLLTKESCRDFLREAASAKCLPIVSAHFGIERVHYPAIEHLRFFRELADSSAFVLHGHHPHMIQGFEDYNGSPLFYSLGNLCFDKLEKTSTHTIPDVTATDEECYAVILSVKKDSIESYEVIALSSHNDGNIIKDDAVAAQLDKINKNTACVEEALRLREEELASQTAVGGHGIGFYLKRLNYKYMGAYLNGRKNRRLYEGIMKEYLPGK